MAQVEEFVLHEAPVSHVLDRVGFHADIRIKQLYDGSGNLISNIHKNDVKRREEAKIERCLQVAGEYTLHIHFYGKKIGYILYDKIRNKMNDIPCGDDGGSDMEEFHIDVKTSKVKPESKLPIWKYRLSITDKEKQAAIKNNGIFVFAICRSGWLDFAEGICKCELCGWAWAKEMETWSPKNDREDFSEKWVRRVYELHPMISLPHKTHWKENKLGLITL